MYVSFVFQLDSLQMIPCESQESGLETGPTRPETNPTRANDLQSTANQTNPQNLDQISNNNSLGRVDRNSEPDLILI